MSNFQERLKAVRKRIAAACSRANRNPDEVSILAASKTRGPDEIKEAADAGLTIFGENRVQEAHPKTSLCPGYIEWHMIGHLQRNKVKDAVQLFSMIHSVDSWKLLETINSASESAGKTMSVCLEINVSGEGSKFGLAPKEAPEILEKSNTLRNIDIVGLMTMPPFTENTEDTRLFFRRLRELRDEWRSSTNFSLNELSAGMSNDFEIAIEEGSTCIRLGSILFGKRTKPKI